MYSRVDRYLHFLNETRCQSSNQHEITKTETGIAILTKALTSILKNANFSGPTTVQGKCTAESEVYMRTQGFKRSDGVTDYFLSENGLKSGYRFLFGTVPSFLESDSFKFQIPIWPRIVVLAVTRIFHWL